MEIDFIKSSKFDEILRLDPVSMKIEINRLSPEERKSFDVFRSIARDVNTLQSSKSQEKSFVANLNELSELYFKSDNKRVITNSRRYAAIAASISAFLISIFIFKMYISNHYSNEALLADITLVDQITYRNVTTVPTEPLDGSTIDLLMSKDGVTPYDVFNLIQYFGSKNDYKAILSQNEKLLNFGDLYIHEFYNNKIVSYLEMNDRASASQWARKAIEDKRITNNYIFLEIYNKLNSPLAKFYN
ncbi:MAG: hypothetical protein R2774_03830 [Saprospiraceae bacterium]